jgi:hypothetical protein
MRCDDCGTELAAGTKFCTECGRASAPEPPGQVLQEELVTPDINEGEAPEAFDPDQAPPPGYVSPHLQERQPTVREVHLDDVLLLIAGTLAVGMGLENLGVPQIQYVILGIVAIIGGGLFLARVISPAILRPLEQFRDLPILGASALLLLWGLVAVLATNVGVLGGLLMTGGGLGLVAMGLKMGAFH